MSSQIIGLQGIESQESVMENVNKNQLSINKEIEMILDKKDIVSRHSYFQLKYFLIGKEPTNQAKMWQCLKELKSRKESLDSLQLEEEEVKDQIELIDIKISRLEKEATQQELCNLEKKEKEIKIRQLRRKKKCAINNLDSLKEKKKWIIEECIFFVQTFKSINEKEELQPFDDIDCQKKYWGNKLSQKLNLKLLTNGQLDNDLIETIVSLPDDIEIKKQMITTLNIRQAQITENLKKTMNKIEESKKG